jgi:hypothetical protein
MVVGEQACQKRVGKSESGEGGREAGRPARSCRHNTSPDAGVYLGSSWAWHCDFFGIKLPPSPILAKQ